MTLDELLSMNIGDKVINCDNIWKLTSVDHHDKECQTYYFNLITDDNYCFRIQVNHNWETKTTFYYDHENPEYVMMLDPTLKDTILYSKQEHINLYRKTINDHYKDIFYYTNKIIELDSEQIMSINCSSKIRKEPKHTCPTIDYVIEILIEQFGKNDGSINSMEEIRDNCSSIRYWGEEWKEFAEYCEANSDHWEKRYEQSEEENSDKTNEIISLQKKIDELESKISDLEFDLKYNYKKIDSD